MLVELKKEKGVKKAELLGVDDFGDSSIDYSLYVDCAMGQQHVIRRKLLRNIKVAFDEAGLEIPYNQLDVHLEK